MSLISVRVSERLLREVDSHAEELHLPRAAYVRQALERMNTAVAAERSRARLIEVSRRVRRESAKVNAEFAEIDDVPDA